MRSRVLAVSIFMLLALPALSSAQPIIVPQQYEAVVEGHTVFSVIEVRSATTLSSAFAPGMRTMASVPVRPDHEGNATNETNVTPPRSVLWFNDQRLVQTAEPMAAVAVLVRDVTRIEDRNGVRIAERTPCTGAVLAVNAGEGLPRDAQGVPFVPEDLQYVRSFRFTDPHDRAWTVDEWTYYGWFTMWSTALGGNDARAHIPDDGASHCPSVRDQPCTVAPVAGACPFASVFNPSEAGRGYPCDGCPSLRYNAVLLLPVDALWHEQLAHDHREDSFERYVGVAGCAAGTEWSCPWDDDDYLEGVSEGYNPRLPYPVATFDQAPHGGTGPCDFVGPYAEGCHAVRGIDLGFGYARQPLVRTFEIFDTDGRHDAYRCPAGHACGGPL